MTITDRLPFVGGEADLETFLDRAARWATDLEYRDVPKPVRRAAKAQLTSTVGAAIWTTTHPLGEPIVEAIESQSSDGEATFLADRDLAPADAARGNAALSSALDFGDSVLGGHTGHSAAFVTLAYAEAIGVGGERALLGHVAANEVAARLGAAAAVGSFRGQQAAYVHAVAAAVGRAVVEDDDADTLADALGTALLQPPWPLEPASLGSDSKVWTASEPVRSGITAVDSARAGLSGRSDLVEADDGFLEAFADRPLETFLEGFGDRWHTRAVTIKPVPGSAYVTAPVEAALEVRGRFDRGRTTIKRVDVHGSSFTTAVDERASPYLDGPASPIGALAFAVPFNVAAALVDGEHTPRQLGHRRKNDGIWRLADRVYLHRDRAFTKQALRSEAPVGATFRGIGLPAVGHAARTVGVDTTLRHLPTFLRFARERQPPSDLSGADRRAGARVEVTTADGRTFEATVEHPSGFAGKPLTEIRAVARNKCRTGLQAAGFREAAARERVDDLLSVDDAERVTLAPLASAASDRREFIDNNT